MSYSLISIYGRDYTEMTMEAIFCHRLECRHITPRKACGSKERIACGLHQHSRSLPGLLISPFPQSVSSIATITPGRHAAGNLAFRRAWSSHPLNSTRCSRQDDHAFLPVQKRNIPPSRFWVIGVFPLYPEFVTGLHIEC